MSSGPMLKVRLHTSSSTPTDALCTAMKTKIAQQELTTSWVPHPFGGRLDPADVAAPPGRREMQQQSHRQGMADSCTGLHWPTNSTHHFPKRSLPCDIYESCARLQAWHWLQEIAVATLPTHYPPYILTLTERVQNDSWLSAGELTDTAGT